MRQPDFDRKTGDIDRGEYIISETFNVLDVAQGKGAMHRRVPKNYSFFS